MDLTPGEKAVLKQVGVLCGSGNMPQFRALTSLWPPTHFETYRGAYVGLVRKQLVQKMSGETFKITDLGLKALGITPVAASRLESRRIEARGSAEKRARPVANTKPQESLASRLARRLLRRGG